MEKTRQNPLISAFGSFFGHVNLNGRLSAAVESDIVGYTTVRTTPGFNMLGAVFTGLDGEPQSVAQVIDGDFQDGDELQVYNKDKPFENRYTIYSYWKDYGGWLDESFNPATQKLVPGTAFWLKTPGRSVDITLRGAVVAGEYKYVSEAGLQMVSLGLPVALDLNSNANWSGLSDGDEIQVRKGDTYAVYSYWKDYGGWLDKDYVPVTEKLTLGASFWLTTSQAGATLSVDGISK